MKTLTKEMILSSAKDMTMALPGIVFTASFGFFFGTGILAILFNELLPMAAYVVMGVSGVLLVISWIPIKKKKKNLVKAEDFKIVILQDKITDKEMHMGVGKYARNSYYVAFKHAGLIGVTGSDYVGYKKGDVCFVVYVHPYRDFMVYSCDEYKLSKELKKCVVASSKEFDLLIGD